LRIAAQKQKRSKKIHKNYFPSRFALIMQAGSARYHCAIT